MSAAHHVSEPAERTPAEYPLEYEAFRQMTQDAYLRYARVRTGDETSAARSVAQMFAELTNQWEDTLRSACPAAAVWKLLSSAVEDQFPCGTACEPQPRSLLSSAETDTVVLHRHLGLTIEETAALMGVERPSVRALLRSAARSAVPCPGRVGERS
ncbi:hypothetical protein [Streptomyces sp. NPDC052042]|uniref:hypothetical protein n=1 Tax=Streptomyces sp. NPDC052042 TaxID=3365683 RepID=UPI0037D05E45